MHVICVFRVGTASFKYRCVHRLMQECLVNMETMLEIFEEEPEIRDNSTVLCDGDGQIEFRNVSFGYKADNVILNDISFIIPPGKTFAVVRYLLQYMLELICTKKCLIFVVVLFVC